MYRDHTKVIKIGDRVIGGGNPILIQSMTNTKTEDVEATVAQILRLEEAGCEIIRCTVPTMEAALALKEIKKQIQIPLVADIHFDYKMAIAAMENGADKIRINPGNIGSIDRIKAVVDCAKERNIPIRIGVNSGSLEKELVEKYHGVTAEGIVESALDKVKIVEDLGYDNLVVSIKSSDVLMCAKAHELIAEKCNYPLHVGITESGTVFSGNIKSSIGLGIILSQGIGDTIRVSLTGDPVEEIKTAKLVLRTLGLRKGGIEVVSCPTCGRTQIDLIKLANDVEIKYSLDHEDVLPDAAVVYPPFTYDNPTYLTACTGFDALAQAIESYWSVKADTESLNYATLAIRKLWDSLPRLVESPTEELRNRVSEGAYWAGKAINVTRTTAAHALSYSLTSHYGYPHGHAVALVFPAVFNLNVHALDNLSPLLDKNGYSHRIDSLLELLGVDRENASRLIADYIFKLGLGLKENIPSGYETEVLLSGVNLSRLGNNPITLDTMQVTEIFNAFNDICV